MSNSEEMRWGRGPAPVTQAWRRPAAAILRGASALLARLATSLASEPAVAISDPRVEFYAQAGAPEGALYVDGALVGWLPGVRRL